MLFFKNIVSTFASSEAWNTIPLFSENKTLTKSVSPRSVKFKLAPRFTSAKHISNKVVIKPPDEALKELILIACSFSVPRIIGKSKDFPSISKDAFFDI